LKREERERKGNERGPWRLRGGGNPGGAGKTQAEAEAGRGARGDNGDCKACGGCFV